MSKLYIETHGCQMNEYDSSRMGHLLSESHDLQMTDDPAEADVILLNTCSIRERAQEKVFHQLGRWKKLKNNNPNLIIGVGGCVASQERNVIRSSRPSRLFSSADFFLQASKTSILSSMVIIVSPAPAGGVISSGPENVVRIATINISTKEQKRIFFIEVQFLNGPRYTNYNLCTSSHRD